MKAKIYNIPTVVKAPERTLVWKKKWISPYESPWGIMEKFRFANSASVDDIYEMFGTEYIRQLKSRRGGNSSCDIITLKGLDGERLNSALGMDVKSITMMYTESILRMIPKQFQNEYYKKYVAMCPECIKEGYHSIFHQLKNYDYCIFHDLKLINSCPNCSQKIPYQLSDKWSKDSFTCICGYRFLAIDSTKDIFNMWSNKPHVKLPQNIIDWINSQYNWDYKEENICIFNNVAYNHDKILDCLSDIFMQKDTALLNYNYLTIYTEKHADFAKIPMDINRKNISKRECDQIFFTELYVSTRQTFKAIARYIRKSFDNKHKNCIRKFVVGGRKADSCPYAHAYVMWRHSLGRLVDYRYVDNGCIKTKSCIIRSFLDFRNNATYYDYNLLNEMYLQITKKISDISLANLAEIKWLFNRVLAFTLLEKFKNYYNKTLENADISFETLEEEDSQPFFVFILPIHTKEKYEFHYWVPKNNSLINIENKTRCSRKGA